MTSRENRCDSALLIMRLMLGLTLVFSHGLPKVVDPESWQTIGLAMEAFGIAFAPVFWGFLASASELVAGVLFVIGLAVRPAAAVMILVMIVAAAQGLATVGDLGGPRAHPIDAAAGYLVLLMLGAGSYSLDRKLGLDSQAAALPRVASV
jgi:putative oxidoreductase